MKSDPKQVFGKAVREQRHALGWSQEVLAERAGLHWTYIGGVERGERNISLMNMVAIARALGSSIKDLTQQIR